MKKDLKQISGGIFGMIFVLILDMFFVKNFWHVFFLTVSIDSLVLALLLFIYKKINK